MLKNNIFLKFCLCIFESDTVKSDCHMQENYESCWFTLLVELFALEMLKKALKMRKKLLK